MSFLRSCLSFFCSCGMCNKFKTQANVRSNESDSESEMPILPSSLPLQSISKLEKARSIEREIINTGKNRILEQLFKKYNLPSRKCVVLIDDDIKNIGPAAKHFNTIYVDAYKEHFDEAIRHIKTTVEKKESCVFAIDLDNTVIDRKGRFIDKAGFLAFVRLAKKHNIPWHIVTARPEMGLNGTPNDNRRSVKELFTQLCRFKKDFNFDDHLHFTGLYTPPDPITPPSPIRALN